jgi:hypothetical protein
MQVAGACASRTQDIKSMAFNLATAFKPTVAAPRAAVRPRVAGARPAQEAF